MEAPNLSPPHSPPHHHHHHHAAPPSPSRFHAHQRHQPFHLYRTNPTARTATPNTSSFSSSSSSSYGDRLRLELVLGLVLCTTVVLMFIPLEIPFWVAMTLMMATMGMYQSYSSSRNPSAFHASHLVAVNPLQWRLSLIDRDFTESDYEMLLALDEQSSSNDCIPLEKHKRVESFISSLSNVNANDTCLVEWRGQSRAACAICLEEFIDGDCVTQLPCSHRFHNDEIERWIRLKPRCPVCSTVLVD